MRDYSKISPSVWHSQRFNNLPSDDGRYLYLYLLTSSHQTSAGCFQLPDGYACSDLRWTLERYKAALEQLVDADLIHLDAETSVVMITRWFKHNPPMSDSHLLGIERVLERIPSVSICEVAQEDLQASWASIQQQKAITAQRKQMRPPSAPNGSGASFPDRLNTGYLGGKK
jgi:hypothetical protein